MMIVTVFLLKVFLKKKKTVLIVTKIEKSYLICSAQNATYI